MVKNLQMIHQMGFLNFFFLPAMQKNIRTCTTFNGTSICEHTSDYKLVKSKTHRHTQIYKSNTGVEFDKKTNMNTDGFWQQSLSESRSNCKILIKSKLWARLESLPSLLMRACCFMECKPSQTHQHANEIVF